MLKLINLVALPAAVVNGIWDTHSWYVGEPATGWTWLFAISFSVCVATSCISGLAPKGTPHGSE